MPVCSSLRLKALIVIFPVILLPIAASAEEPATKGVLETPPVKVQAAPDKAEIRTVKGSFRLGYADLAKIAEESSVGKVAKAHYEAKADKYKARIETKQKMLEKQKAALEAKIATYTPEQRVAKVKEYEKKVEEFKKMLQKADSEMKPMQEELLRDVYGKIEKAADEYGASNGFSAIVNKRELLYLGKDVDVQDVTETLIKHLDAK